jgi:glycosyltransferase involved in cell wall biosynthesis
LVGVVALDAEDDEEAPEPPGALAAVGILTGPLDRASRMQNNARHHERWAMVAPNSDRLPPRLVDLLLGVCTELLAPSEWAKDVLQNHLPPARQCPVHVVPHGIAQEFKPDLERRSELRRQYEAGRFLIRHFSSSDRQRKGTIELIQAWEELHETQLIPPMAELELVLDPSAHSAVVTWLADRNESVPTNVTLTLRADASASEMRHLLTTCHLVCQPSRGEAFGLVPLEALACGTPVVATGCTGHSEYLTEDNFGWVEIEHGALEAIDDLPGARAPSVSPDAIGAALAQAYAQWVSRMTFALAGSKRTRERWQWRVQLAPLVTRLKLWKETSDG